MKPIRALRFCMITTFYPPYSFGGDAIYLHRLCNELGRQGHLVDVVHCADSFRMFKPEPSKTGHDNHRNVTVHKLESGMGALSPLLSHQTGFPLLKSTRIRKIFADGNFDVIHYHNISLFGPGVLELAPAQGRCIKLYTMHEHWLVCPTSVLWKFDSRACEKAECLSCSVAAHRPPQLWRYTNLRDRAATQIDQFLSPSRFTIDMHHDRGFTSPIEQLPYFLDRVDEEWKNPGLSPNNRPYFLFVGRLEKIKGLQEILPEFAGDGDYDLVISGSGTYESELKKQAAGMARVKFAGWLPQHEIGRYYANSIGVIVPSITYETFGIIIIEAFARKKPVIVHELGALPEVVSDSGGGFTYKNSLELRRAMAKLAGNPAFATALGEKGYAAFCRWWCAEPHLQRYYALIENAASKKLDAADRGHLQLCRNI